MLWINGKMTDLTKKDAIHKLVDAKGFLERYSNPHDKWTEAINIGIEAIEIVMDQEEQEATTKNDLGVDCISRADAIRVASGYCHPSNVAKELAKLPSVTPQEPVLDKIKGQIEDYLHGVEITLEVLVENDPLRPKMEGAKYTLEECLELINKAETEDTDGTNK